MMLSKLQELSEDLKDSRKLVLVVVLTALLLDNFLLTVVVPVIPGYLISLVENKHNSYHNTTWHAQNTNGSENSTFEWNSHQNKTDLQLWEAVLYKHENSRIGWLLASKALVQLVVNPVVGPLINRYGCSLPMTVGMVLLLGSSLLFAFGRSYPVLFAARTLHGFSSPCINIAGLSLLARLYPDDKERSQAMGLALGGLGVGVILGYPFGGLSLFFMGKPATFLVIAFLILCQILFQCFGLQESQSRQVSLTGTSLTQLLKDPYILICAGIILVPEMTMALIESTVPLWLIEKFHPPNWQLGTVFIPDSIGFWIACNLFGFVAVLLGRWRCSMFSLLCIGTCLLCIPLIGNISHLIIPHFGIGLSLGIIDASLLPMMALLVDTRHVVEYGNVYAITQVAISLGFALGPIFGSLLLPVVGFPWLVRGMGLVNLLCIPLCLFLRSPPTAEESISILGSSSTSSAALSGPKKEAGFKFNRLREED